jgi:hypothetical protein
MKEAAKYKRMHEDALDLCKRYIVHLHNAERERDEARAEAASSLAMARIAGDKHDQKCAEVDVLRGVGCEEDGDGSCGVCRKCAYRRGAEAMREACANAVERSLLPHDHTAQSLRALPIPEEP